MDPEAVNVVAKALATDPELRNDINLSLAMCGNAFIMVTQSAEDDKPKVKAVDPLHVLINGRWLVEDKAPEI